MNVIKHLKEDKIELNGIVYKPYKVCELPPSFGEDILSWVNYRGYTYIREQNYEKNRIQKRPEIR